MNFIKALWIIILFSLIILILQFPDSIRGDSSFEYMRIPDRDLCENATALWNSEQRAAAIYVLDYIIEAQLPQTERAIGLREGYMAALLEERTPQGKLASLGLEKNIGMNLFEALRGVSVADFASRGLLNQLADSEEIKRSTDPLLQAANSSANTITLYPASEPAWTLLKVARLTGAMNETLASQMTDFLNYIKNLPNPSQTITAIQDNIMPLYQFARKCKSWAEFSTILKYASSVDQLKVLTAVVSSSPKRAKQLTAILIVAGNIENGTYAISRILQQGTSAIDLQWYTLRKGKEGLLYVLKNPNFTIRNAMKDIPAWKSWLYKTGLFNQWQKIGEQYGVFSVVIKYACLFVLIVLLLRALFSPAIFTRITATAEDETRHSNSAAYWTGVLFVSLAICVLLIAPFLASMPSKGKQEGSIETASSYVENAPAVQHPSRTIEGSGTAEHHNAFLIVVLVPIIVIAQGICWLAARRRLKIIEDDFISSVQLKLKRLDNMEIFFDLPLYCGLAITIFAFILISTFGIGISRFLAYSSTFIGIVLTVILRIGYLYPLREKLMLALHNELKNENITTKEPTKV
jgi:hypothetical protein